MTQDDLDTVDKALESELEASAGAQISASYYPHRVDQNCDCRKPKAGLIVQALRDFQDRSRADGLCGRFSDGHAGGLHRRRGPRFSSSPEPPRPTNQANFSVEPDNVFNDLAAAVRRWLLALRVGN